MANPKFVLRSLDVFAMYGLNNLPPFGSPGQAAILAAINKEQGSSIAANQVTIGGPVATDPSDTLFNTSVLLTSVANQGLKGSYTFRYNRATASAATALNSLILPGDSEFTVTDTHSLIPLINSATGLTLVPADIVNETIPPGSNSFNVKAASTSYFFLPGTTFKVYSGQIVGAPWMLFDVGTLTDLQGTGATATLSSATLDNTYLIDGEPSLKIASGGSLTINLGELFDTRIPEWTFEWSIRLTQTTSTYVGLFQMQTATTYSFASRTSDSGFGLRIQQGVDLSSQSGAYNFPFGAASKQNVLVRYAAVKKNGLITMFVDGKATKLANGTTNNYNVNSFPAGVGLPNNTKIVLGTLAENIGHIRISKFARYTVDYTPKPFKPKTFASVAPVTDALGFDPE